MKKPKKQAPAQLPAQESLFLWVDPATVDTTRWEYGVRLRRDTWQMTAGLRLAVRGKRVIVWTVQLDDGSHAELVCAATVLRQQIADLGQRGEIHIRLISDGTLSMTTRNQVSQKGGSVTIRDGDGLNPRREYPDVATLRVLLEQPISQAERAEWRERLTLHDGIRAPAARERSRQQPVRSRPKGPRPRQLAIKLPAEQE